VTGRLRLLTAVFSVAFLVVHLRALPHTLEDIDSINFALGVEHFDVAVHRPHPPGYPIYIVLAKASTAAVHAAIPGWDRDRRAPAGLALWSVAAGASAAFVVTRFWIALGYAPRAAWLAMAIALTSPLFWLTASRPLSDVPGLVAAMAVQAIWIDTLRRPRTSEPDPLSGRAIGAAAATGLLIGLRSQTIVLTGPLFALVLIERRHRWREAAGLACAAAAGVLTWGLPLVAVSGGIGPYIRAIGVQGAEDFAGVQMLSTAFSGPLIRAISSRTFVQPWDVRLLAHIVLGLALIGAGMLAWRRRSTLELVVLAFGPYLLFHMFFQESETLRYALPIVVPVAGLAAAALARIPPLAGSACAAAIAVVSLVTVQPVLAAYAADGAPVFRVFQDMHAERVRTGEQPVVKMHHQVWWGVRRVMDWYRPAWNTGPQPFPGDREWLDVVRHFNSGDARPVWFLAHLTRTDLAAFDRRDVLASRRYELDPAIRSLVGGRRLDSLAWWRLHQPGWMLGRGWAITPELAGMTAQDRAAPDEQPADAFVLGSTEKRVLLLGGRYLGPANGPDGRLILEHDGRVVAEWIVSGAAPWFVHWIELPAGIPAASGPYAHLTVRVAPVADGGAAPAVGLEQFDVAAEDDVMVALLNGWYEHEENPQTGRDWRWTSGRSTIEIRGPARSIVIAGESPLKNFPDAPRVTVRAGSRILAVFSPSTDFSERIPLSADALASSGGVVTIETDRTFRPRDRGSPDPRTLGLRVYAIAVE
jgi:hypothetical protein